MGRAVCAAVDADPDLQLVAAVAPRAAGERCGTVAAVADLDALIEAGAEVVVDFTVAAAARDNLGWCADHGLHVVEGTSGLSAEDVDAIRASFTRSNCVIAANFSISAVLMMRFAEMAAPFFDTAEIIEMHHDGKADAPSGTAVATAQRMVAASSDWGADPTKHEVLGGARGATVGGVRVHAVRMRGMVGSQEVLLGAAGQTLTIRHDTFDRTSYMPGVVLAIKQIRSFPGLTIGLDAFLGL